MRCRIGARSVVWLMTATCLSATSAFAQSAAPEQPARTSMALFAAAQNAGAPPPSQRWIGRHPIWTGTLIGGGAAMVWQAASCNRGSCNTATAGLVGAGVGAYTGLVVSAVRKVHRQEPVSRKMKIGLIGGAIGGAAAAFLACYGAGGCGGVS